MAKIKFGMMMTDARGKLGGQVFSKNRSGSYVRTKVTPVNPRSIFQQANRVLLGSISSAWSALSGEQRSAWNSAVTLWEKTNVFGDLQKPTGKNLFTSLNKVVISSFVDGVIMETPPSKVELPSFVIQSASLVAVSGNLSITLGEVGSNATVQVRATPPVSAGTTFVNNLLRVLPNSLTNVNSFVANESGVVSAGVSYPIRFGTVTSGQKIFVEVRALESNGQLGVPSLYTIIVT